MGENELEVRMRNVENALSRIEAKLDTALTDISDHEERLRALEGKPGNKWEAAVGQVITIVIAAAIGYFIAK